MTKYRYVTLTYPDGRQVKSVVKDKDVHPELLRLQMLYGLKVRLGRFASDKELAQYPGVGLKQPAIPPDVRASRPLSPDFGRGSGTPV